MPLVISMHIGSKVWRSKNMLQLNENVDPGGFKFNDFNRLNVVFLKLYRIYSQYEETKYSTT